MKNSVVIETDKTVLVMDEETKEVLKGIKEGLDDLKSGNFTVETL